MYKSVNFQDCDTPKRTHQTFEPNNIKKYKIKLTDEELKPKTPVRELDFQDYMVRNIDIIMGKLERLENENRGLKFKLENTDIIMEKLERLENENKELKSKFENMNNDFLQLTTSIENVTKALYNKSLSYEEKLRKIEKIQEENPHKIRIERISSDGIARYTHKDGTLVCFV